MRENERINYSFMCAHHWIQDLPYIISMISLKWTHFIAVNPFVTPCKALANIMCVFNNC